MFSKTAILVSILAVTGTASADLNKGLVAYYPFNGNADDMSNNHNNGVLHGGVSLTNDHNGNANDAYSFNGIDGFILARANGLPTATRTVVTLFKANTVSGHPAILGYGGDSLSNCGTSWLMSINIAVYPKNYYFGTHCDINTLVKSYLTDRNVLGKWIQMAVSTNTKGTIM